MKQQHLFLIKFILVFAIFIAYSQSALAIGPGTGGSKIRVNDEEHGPYILLVATAPLPVAVGQMSVWVRVTGTEDNQLRRDARVIIEATPRDGGQTITVEGSHKNAGNDFDYVAHMDVDQSGQWDITVSVVDELGEAEVSFSERVTGGQSASTLIVLAIPFVVGVIVVGIYLWRRSATS